METIKFHTGTVELKPMGSLDTPIVNGNLIEDREYTKMIMEQRERDEAHLKMIKQQQIQAIRLSTEISLQGL